MTPEERPLSRQELEEDFETIHIFVNGLATRRMLMSQDYRDPQGEALGFPRHLVLSARCWHVSPLWMNNEYTNFLS